MAQFPLDFTRNMNTPAININLMPSRVSLEAGSSGWAQTFPLPSEKLVLAYGDPEFEKKLHAPEAVKVLELGLLPPGVKLLHGLDEIGFFCQFDISGTPGLRFDYPRGLKEIRVNGQSVDVELEKKWLLEGFLSSARCSFLSFNNDSGARVVLSYLCALAQMPPNKVESVISSY